MSVSLVFFANGFVVASWLPHIPEVKERLGLDDFLLGIALFSMAAGSVLVLPLAGEFQAMNALAALGLVIATGSPVSAATAALAGLTGVPGRLQFVAGHEGGGAIVVDYAHTPDALATVLAALRPHADRRLAVLFGCGGDRDAAGLQPEKDLGFRIGNRLDRRKEAEMHRLDRRDYGNMRSHQPGKARDLAGMVHAELEYPVTSFRW